METAYQKALVRAERQALEDVARTRATAVSFVRAPTEVRGTEWLDAVTQLALDAGFVVARVGVFRERAFDELDILVRAVGRALRSSAMAEDERGLGALLETSGERRGVRKAVSEGPIGSEVFELAADYLDALEAPVRERNRIDAWLSGVDERKERAHKRALTRRNAKRALGDISQLVLALGHKGLALLFEGADILSRLPAARREQSYIVLRELIDNADGGRGLSAVRVIVSGTGALFNGPRSLKELEPLAMRVASADARAPLPHQPIVVLEEPAGFSDRPAPLRKASAEQEDALAAIMRACHGVPATEPSLQMTVANERIDRQIEQLLSLSGIDGSVFSLVSGAFGSGKTHLLLHLTARALKEKRPVFRLSLERLDADLGNPQKHLHRLLDQSVIPLPGRPSALDALAEWTRNETECEKLLVLLRAIADGEGDAAAAARRCVRSADHDDNTQEVLRSFLSAHELADRPASASYRHDAYGRILLWVALLAKKAGCSGPIVLIDEAENLYRLGMREAERRTALRSLSFYCGGALPGACVVLAITPDALKSLKDDARVLLDEVSDQATVLAWEDASLFRSRLKKSPVLAVPALDEKELLLLASKVRRVHERARGKAANTGFRTFVNATVAAEVGPRALIRSIAAYLEDACFYAD